MCAFARAVARCMIKAQSRKKRSGPDLCRLDFLRLGHSADVLEQHGLNLLWLEVARDRDLHIVRLELKISQSQEQRGNSKESQNLGKPRTNH